MVCKNWHIVLPEYGAHAPESVGEAFISNPSHWQLVYKNWHFVLSECGAHVPESVGEAFISNPSHWQLVYKNWHFVLPEYGTHVPESVGEARFMFVLIRTVRSIYENDQQDATV